MITSRKWPQIPISSRSTFCFARTISLRSSLPGSILPISHWQRAFFCPVGRAIRHVAVWSELKILRPRKHVKYPQNVRRRRVTRVVIRHFEDISHVQFCGSDALMGIGMRVERTFLPHPLRKEHLKAADGAATSLFLQKMSAKNTRCVHSGHFQETHIRCFGDPVHRFFASNSTDDSHIIAKSRNGLIKLFAAVLVPIPREHEICVRATDRDPCRLFGRN